MMEKIELNLALLNELIEEYEMFEETFCLERDRQIFAMGTSVEYLKGDKPNMYREKLSDNYKIGNGRKLEEHITGMRKTLEYADTSLTELRQECERVGHTVGAFGSGAFSNMKFMYNDSVKNEIVNCSNRIYNESRMLYQTLMEINSEIAPIVKEDFSSQIKSGRRQLDQIRDFMQAFIILAKRVMEKIAEIISRLRECAETETQDNNDVSDVVGDVVEDVVEEQQKIEIDMSKWLQRDRDNFNLVSDSLNSLTLLACSFIGTKYTYGGESIEEGFDCSGFVQYLYSQYGITLPRTSSDQLQLDQREDFVVVSLDDAKPGDIVCYSGHVAIYLGNGKIVHASNSKDYINGGGIKTSNVDYENYIKIVHYVGEKTFN